MGVANYTLARAEGHHPDTMKVTATLDIKVRASSCRNAVSKIECDTVHVDIKAPAKNNKANTELAKYLGKVLGVGHENIKILKGAASCNKIVRIEAAFCKHDAMKMLENEVAKQRRR